MTAYVFLGPTLPVDEARAVLDAVYLPPVAQGDVQRACRHRPSLIAIIDGLFERVPAVWHKEILWALNQGIPVLGASSMGALRAAELDTFGMEGVGWVYEAFRDGLLEDDDEVAVVHSPAEGGFRAMSEAMVNIRRTLAAATTAGVIDAATEQRVVEVAKARYYPDRHYPGVLSDAAEAGVPAEDLEPLRSFIRDQAIDQKREDALALLSRVRDRLDAGATSIRPRFTFQYSSSWFEAQRNAGSLRTETDDAVPGGSQTSTMTDDELLDELRLDPAAYRRAWETAAARLGALEHLQAAGVEVSQERLQATADAFRREKGLLDPVAAEGWLRENDLSEAEVAELMRREALVRWSWSNRDPLVKEQLPDLLRLTGAYPSLVTRAREKAEHLAEVGYAEASLEDLDLSWDGLLDWYFHTVQDTDVPEDLEAFAAHHGYADVAHLRRALVREYAYRTAGARPSRARQATPAQGAR